MRLWPVALLSLLAWDFFACLEPTQAWDMIYVRRIIDERFQAGFMDSIIMLVLELVGGFGRVVANGWLELLTDVHCVVMALKIDRDMGG